MQEGGCVKSDYTETNPLQFSKEINERKKPKTEDRENSKIHERWSWVEAKVWTERMLTALEEGVKGGKWYCLMDKVLKEENLLSSFGKVKDKNGAAGIDHVTVKMFESGLEKNLRRLRKQLKEGKYIPQPVRRIYISKQSGKDKRPLGIPTVRDRVVQGALRQVLEPIFERDFAENSYGFRPGRSCKDALRRVQNLIGTGHKWVVDGDIKSYFDSIKHKRLIELIERKVTDQTVLGLIAKFLKQEVMEGMKRRESREGTPQGAVLSPLLANIYLDPFDHVMAEEGYEMIRYADDFVVMCRNEEEAKVALKKIKRWMKEAGLELHLEKTRIVDVNQKGGFDFLGYHFERGWKWPRKKSLKKLRDAIREKTKRCNGKSLEEIIKKINPILRGWFEYYKHSTKRTFPSLDGWVRMRLRSILRKRNKLKGRGRGADHQRWPNEFFAGYGLFSMVAARESVCQSAKR